MNVNDLKQTDFQNSIVAYLTWGLLALLLFLLVFESAINLPVWLQPIGRMHPLLLHFPIVLLILMMAIELFKKSFTVTIYHSIIPPLALTNAALTVLSALMGLFLAQEGEYSRSGILWHKWSGAALAILSMVLFSVSSSQQQSSGRAMLYRLGLLIGFPLLVLGTHQGAEITHGKDFLWEPLKEEEPRSTRNTGNVYLDHIDPILQSKCVKCHNDEKTKGGLNLNSYDRLMHGGDSGPIIMAGKINESELVRRIQLPLEDEEHMPPEGKKPLSNQEKNMIIAWIEDGAGNKTTLADLSDTAQLKKLVTMHRKGQESKSYRFKAASPRVIEKLNGPFRSVRPLEQNSPALEVDLFVRKMYTPDLLSQLRSIREQIVHLNLSHMPIQDDDLDFIATFSNLEVLLLNHTDISGAGLDAFNSHPRLRSISVTSTSVRNEHLQALKDVESLRSVYLWNTEISNEELVELSMQMPNVRFDDGYRSEDEDPIRLNTPLVKNQKEILERGELVELNHQLNGVEIVLSTDGSEPTEDSQIYHNPIEIHDFTQINAFARKEGWLSSKTVTYNFFVRGKEIDITLLTDPNQQYIGQGAATLTNLDRGEINSFGSSQWLGYREQAFSALIDLGQNAGGAREVVLSYGVNIGAYIMPPSSIEILGGNSKTDLRRILRKPIEQPIQYEPNEEVALSLMLPEQEYRYLRITANPVKKLPSWHNGAGDRGWVFVDELFVY